MSKGRIVVVEDESIVARDIQATLRSFGYEVPEIVTSGEDAIQAAFRLHPDLMMMDIMIKGVMDGVDAAEIIRSQFNIPVVYLTAYSDDDTLRRAKLTDSYGFISKPYDERELYVAVEFALYRHQMNFKMMETKSWLESLIRSLPEALIATDRDQKISMVNTRAETLLGWKEYEMKGMDLADFFKQAIRVDGEAIDRPFVFEGRQAEKLALVYRQDAIRNEKGLVMGKVLTLRKQD